MASKISAHAQFFADLEDYLTEEFNFGDTARAFIARFAPLFAGMGATRHDDIPLPCYNAFVRYQELLEGKLATFLKRQGVSPRQFYAWCRDALEGVSERDGGNREFVQILCASETFEMFFELMCQTVQMQAAVLRLEQENAQLDSLERSDDGAMLDEIVGDIDKDEKNRTVKSTFRK